MCPSCKTPLIARQGQLKEWHFAHRSTNTHLEIKKECEYSFEVSVRLMIRQLAINGLRFKTPKYVSYLEEGSDLSGLSNRVDFTITEESLIVLRTPGIGVNFSETVVDILGYVNDIPFIVYITYKDRIIPIDINPPNCERCGVVEVNVNGLLSLFKKEKEGNYIQVLRRFIEEGIEGKSWVYHPRTAIVKKQAELKMKQWLLQQKTHYPKINDPSALPTIYLQPQEQKTYAFAPKEPKIENYQCVICKAHWTSASPYCEKCDTHLYTRIDA
ncbi:MAG: competence protein CoiA family protein [Colwellia sp.]